MTEFEHARFMANFVLDVPFADPDRTEAMLARQLLRRDEHFARAIKALQAIAANMRSYDCCEGGRAARVALGELASAIITEKADA